MHQSLTPVASIAMKKGKTITMNQDDINFLFSLRDRSSSDFRKTLSSKGFEAIRRRIRQDRNGIESVWHLA
jgi:hypothetical protein